MLPCPRCDAAIEDDAIACPKCKTVVRFFCESCDTPILINLRQCPSCGAENSNYDAAFDKDRVEDAPKPATKAMESEFDDESSSIAKEIAELKNELGKSEMAAAFSAARSRPAKQSKPGKQNERTVRIEYVSMPGLDRASVRVVNATDEGGVGTDLTAALDDLTVIEKMCRERCYWKLVVFKMTS